MSFAQNMLVSRSPQNERQVLLMTHKPFQSLFPLCLHLLGPLACSSLASPASPCCPSKKRGWLLPQAWAVLVPLRRRLFSRVLIYFLTSPDPYSNRAFGFPSHLHQFALPYSFSALLCALDHYRLDCWGFLALGLLMGFSKNQTPVRKLVEGVWGYLGQGVSSLPLAGLWYNSTAVFLHLSRGPILIMPASAGLSCIVPSLHSSVPGC